MGRDYCTGVMGTKRGSHGKDKRSCVECSGCPHGKLKRNCAACNSCPHGKVQGSCAKCSPCPHGNLKGFCAVCNSAREDPPSLKRVKREPESSPEIKQELEIKQESEPFTNHGYFGIRDENER